MKKKTHGGARKGAGRKKKSETKVMRIPLALVEIVITMIDEYKAKI